MSPFGTSLRSRLTAAILTGTAISSLVLLGAVIALEVRTSRNELGDRLELAGRLVAESSVAALAFGDVEAAERALARLQTVPAVTHARIVDLDGRVVASWSRAGRTPFPEAPPLGERRWSLDALVLHLPVDYQDTRYGGLVLRATNAEVTSRIGAYAATALALLAGVLALSWWVARRLQARISGPILALAGTMERVSREHDFGLRVEVGGADEIASLCAGFNDMLAQIRARQAAREQAERQLADLATAVEQAGEAVLVTDHGGAITYVNPRFTRTTGIPAEEAVGRTIREVAERIHPRLAALLQPSGDAPGGSGRFSARRADGARYTAEVSTAPIRGPAGGLAGRVAIVRDVTEQIRLEAQLHQTQKMEAIGTLAGGIAHDFNNVLSAMLGFTTLAREEVHDGSELAANLDDVLAAGSRASALVKQILTFSRQADEEGLPLELAPVVKEVLKLLRATLPSTIEVASDLSTASRVVASPTQIHQVVMNLCTNAGLAMKETGGRITVTLGELNLDGAFCRDHPGVQPGPHLELSVGDTGPGIEPEVRDRIFEPFFTTRAHGEGTGLGLSVVHGIVTRLGGAVTVRSEPGHGAVFSVYLPRAAAAQQPGEAPAAAPRGGAERILVVDDEPRIGALVERVLRKLGYQVSLHARSEEALAAFTAGPERFDALVTDLTMPGLTGRELIREVRRMRPDLPVILCSGFATPDEPGPEGATPVHVLAKPFVPEALARALRAALDARAGGPGAPEPQGRSSIPTR